MSMKLEQQVTSLNLSKRLKKLGVKQESYIVWFYNGIEWALIRELSILMGVDILEKMPRMYSAFTVAELGELLPEQRYWTTVKTNTGSWRCSEYDENGLAEGGKTSFIADTEAEARGLMLACIIEHKLLGV